MTFDLVSHLFQPNKNKEDLEFQTHVICMFFNLKNNSTCVVLINSFTQRKHSTSLTSRTRWETAVDEDVRWVARWGAYERIVCEGGSGGSSLGSEVPARWSYGCDEISMRWRSLGAPFALIEVYLNFYNEFGHKRLVIPINELKE